MNHLRATEAPLVGTSLVEASAGTGKTHTITTLFLRLVLEEGLTVPSIVVVTFTEAATAELRSRIRRRLCEALAALDDPARAADPDLRAVLERVNDRADARRRLVLALSELDLAAISTIHAFCFRALQERAFETGARFGLTLATDTFELLREITEDYWSRCMVPMAADAYRLVRSEVSIEVTRKLVATLARRPRDLPVLPDDYPPDPETLRPTLDARFATARTTWRAKCKSIRKLLDDSDALSRAQKDGYCEANLDRWCAELDDYFATETATFTLVNGLVRLSRSGLAERAKRNRTPPFHRFFAEADALVDVSKQAQRNALRGIKRRLVDYVRTELASRKAVRGIQGFEDLLAGLDQALAREGGDALLRPLRAQFKAALIDEFQDTDPVQFRIFRRIFHSHATLLVVGDPKQSIYAFRGADVFSYFQAARDAGQAIYTLDTNHRSDPSLVRAVNAIFARAQQPFVFDEIGFKPVKAHAPKDRIALADGAAFEILFLPRAAGADPHGKGNLRKELPSLVAAEIARFLASGAKVEGRPVRAGDIAILTRTNAQAWGLQEALRKLQIPTALETEASVFESDEAKELEQVLRAVLEPTRPPLVRAALATSIVGLRADEIVSLEADEQGWERWSERFRKLQDVWARRGFMPAYQALLRTFAVEPRLLSYVDGERRVTNLLHLGDVLHAAATRGRLGLAALVAWLGAMRTDPHEDGHLTGEAAELRLESDARAAKLLTIHKSKGLEYPIVYCPYLWDGSVGVDATCIAFHDRADGQRLKLHLAPEDAPDVVAAAECEARAELQRLLYVALTRAKHRCSIVWGAINATEDSCLAYTLHPGRTGLVGLSDSEIRADFAALSEAAEGAVSVRDLVEAPAPAYVDEERDGSVLAARAFDRKVDAWWRIGSYSGMTSKAGHAEHAPAAPEIERPGEDEDEADASEESAAAEGTETTAETPVVLHTLPRGTKAGTMLHEILEEHDFVDRNEERLAALVRAKLESFGYSAESITAPLVRGIDALLDTPLGIGTSLRAVARDRRIDEMEFLLPVAQQDRALVTPKRIAEAFAVHPTEKVPAGYVDQLRSLGFLPLRGFLRGFIDLVFEHDGRYYVVDYKSNHLGATAASYAPPRLAAAMARAHYFLQYHLYAVAVHRWLERCMRGYVYERAFGGVLYLFARGMSPAHPAGTGIFIDRPQLALIETLSEVLAHG